MTAKKSKANHGTAIAKAKKKGVPINRSFFKQLAKAKKK